MQDGERYSNIAKVIKATDSCSVWIVAGHTLSLHSHFALVFEVDVLDVVNNLEWKTKLLICRNHLIVCSCNSMTELSIHHINNKYQQDRVKISNRFILRGSNIHNISEHEFATCGKGNYGSIIIAFATFISAINHKVIFSGMQFAFYITFTEKSKCKSLWNIFRIIKKMITILMICSK